RRRPVSTPFPYTTLFRSDASGDGKFLDVFAKYKLGGNSGRYLRLGQFKQPNSLEELSSSKNNDFIAKAMVTNTFAVSRRLGIGRSEEHTSELQSRENLVC